jgi:hypothetical protein
MTVARRTTAVRNADAAAADSKYTNQNGTLAIVSLGFSAISALLEQ